MIRKSLLQLIFSGSFMKRWNDKLRPVELWEVDKQAHKMITAWALYQENKNRCTTHEEQVNLGQEIIEGGIFEYLYRLIITDIKPPIFYRIKSNPDHYRQLTDWVLEQLQPRLQSLGPAFWSRLEGYFSVSGPAGLGRDILDAAHLYASQWEFHLIQGINPWDEELADIEATFVRGLAEYKHVQGVPQIQDEKHNALGRFLRQCGQLRFQKRWSQTPRIPETSVLGHMFIVACYAYFFSLVNRACPLMGHNNFFAGLFHDLPELLTRDIISPVKRSVAQIGDLIREYEEHEVQRRVLGLLEQGGYEHVARRLHYFLGLEFGSEFVPTVIQDHRVQSVERQELMGVYNKNEFDPKDGELLKVCDSLAAFIEAYTAMRNGITTDQLSQAVWRIRRDYNNFDLGNGLHIGSLLADFD